MKEELIFAFSAVEYQYNPPSKEHPDYYARLADAALKVVLSMPVSAYCNTDKEPSAYSDIGKQPTDTQDNDGWIEWNGDFPNGLPDDWEEIEIKFGDGSTGKYVNRDWFNWPYTLYHIIAYRIIDEPKKECVCKTAFAVAVNNLQDRVCSKCGEIVEFKEPKKQTLLEFMDAKTGYTGELLPKAAFERRQVYVNISEYLESVK